MKTKGRRQSKNIEDVRSPAGNALVSNQNKKDYPDVLTPFGDSVDLSPREKYRAQQSAKSLPAEAKGPFKQMVSGMEPSAKRFERQQIIKRVTSPDRSRMDTSTMKPDKNGDLHTIVKPRRRKGR